MSYPMRPESCSAGENKVYMLKNDEGWQRSNLHSVRRGEKILDAVHAPVFLEEISFVR